MNSLFSWIKANKLAALLLVLVVLLVGSSLNRATNSKLTTSVSDSQVAYESAMPDAANGFSTAMRVVPAPAPDVENRMIVQNSRLSLVVNNVTEAAGAVRSYVQSMGGYLVSSVITKPEEGGTATVTVRIPTEKLDEALSHLKSQAVKVVSEDLEGTDVTDQYVDNLARLAILERNKARFEEIMTSATEVKDILAVQSEIFNLQAQIDRIKGQQNYLEQTAKMSLVTLYLSTDELALPYAPSEAWRPQVIFKQAVRSLMSFLQSAGTMVIWIAVFAVIWLPLAVAVWWVQRRFKRPLPQSKP